jgi:kinesin family member 2/24
MSLAAPQQTQQQQQQQQPSQQPQQQSQQTTTQQSIMSNNASSRRSYVVKEVERLKENREKRRARQNEIREEKTALMNMDPGNPNWELAAMIR